MKMRLFARPSEPRIPSAPPMASGTIGSTGESTATSPTLSVSTRIVGTVAAPVTPCSVTGGDRSMGIPSAKATMAVTAEWLAPVSRTSRKGPRSLMNTGAQIRPIWSRRVGATKRGSCASTMISASSSAASAAGVGGATAGAAPTHALATLTAPRRVAVRSARQPMEELAFKRTTSARSIAPGRTPANR